jgi:hypothetical protein
LLEKRVFAERQYFFVAQSADQLKTDFGLTLLAAGKDFTCSEGCFMHETVGIVMDAVNAAPEHTLSRQKLVHSAPKQPGHKVEPQGLRGQMQELTF